MQGKVKVKSLPKIVLSAYLFVLLWFVLFKFSYDILSVIETLHMRSFDLVPFVGNRLSEMLENVIIFIPLGLLLRINFKETALWRMCVFIFTLSLSVELIQYILAIGITDITDVITNVTGGLLGLALYESGKKYAKNEKLDRFVLVVTMLLLIIIILLRIFVFRVKY